MVDKIYNIIMILLFMLMGISITLAAWYQISPETFIEVKHQLLLEISTNTSQGNTSSGRKPTALDVIPLK